MHEHIPELVLIAIAFWIFVMLITIVPIVLHHRRKVETEKTIRMAIEKGASLDPALLERLLGASAAEQQNSGDTPQNVRRGGVMTASVGVGLYFLSVFMGLKILIGPALLVLCIGIGLFISATYMASPPSTPKPGDKA